MFLLGGTIRSRAAKRLLSRKAMVVLSSAVVLLACLGGCSPQRGSDSVKTVLKAQTDLLALLKRIRNKDRALQLKERIDKLADRAKDNLKAFGAVWDRLSDDEKLQLQLKYGPPMETVYSAATRAMVNMERLLAQDTKKGFVLPPAMVQEAEIDPEIAGLLDGYSTMSRRLLGDLTDLSNTLQAIQSSEQVAGAIGAVRKLRYRLSLDTIRLVHVVPRQFKDRIRVQAECKGLIEGPLAAVKAESERIGALTGGQDLVTVIEPLPDYLAQLIAAQ
jgi:hypothetical protein